MKRRNFMQAALGLLGMAVMSPGLPKEPGKPTSTYTGWQRSIDGNVPLKERRWDWVDFRDIRAGDIVCWYRDGKRQPKKPGTAWKVKWPLTNVAGDGYMEIRTVDV